MIRQVLLLEPYYGGSHKRFLRGLQNNIEARFTLFTLPARKWKIRMQLSALWFVQEIRKLPIKNRYFDTVLCSTFVDVAVLRALLLSVSGWNVDARILTYFHENQFAYPGQISDPSIRQFTAINFSTAMASDACAFNSKYNMESFLCGINSFLKRATDIQLPSCVDEIREKSVLLYPGMEYSFIDRVTANMEKEYGNPPVIVWNHRWEHDKGPESFFDALYYLQYKGVDFRLIVLGQTFSNQPQCFKEAQVRLEKELLHFGYVASRDEYAKLLSRGDLILSTAKHEFFGISVLEGIRAGCYPLLPKDLAYPELYGEGYLYEQGTLPKRLLAFVKNPIRMEENTALNLSSTFEWRVCRKQYEKFLFM